MLQQLRAHFGISVCGGMGGRHEGPAMTVVGVAAARATSEMWITFDVGLG